MLNHPLAQLAPTTKRRAFILFFILTAIISWALTATGGPLTTDLAPAGIVSFEFARDWPTAAHILGSWDSVARQRAAFNLGLDFLYPPLYGTTIALGCLLAAGVWTARRQRAHRSRAAPCAPRHSPSSH